MPKTAKDWIKHLQLEPHPEGGYYKRIYQAQDDVTCGERKRLAYTSIYYLLAGEDYSAWHRIKSDEIWHFYQGSPIIIYMMENGEVKAQTLGEDQFQFCVPGNTWFAAEVKDKTSFSLVGCTVAPGFDFEDFELAANRTHPLKCTPS